MTNTVRVSLCAAASAALVGALGTGVAAATPNTSQYDNPATSQPTVVGSTKAAHVSSKPTKKPVASIIKTTQPAKQGLPFTGLSLVTFFALGAALLAGGLFLRFLARRRTAARSPGAPYSLGDKRLTETAERPLTSGGSLTARAADPSEIRVSPLASPAR